MKDALKLEQFISVPGTERYQCSSVLPNQDASDRPLQVLAWLLFRLPAAGIRKT